MGVFKKFSSFLGLGKQSPADQSGITLPPEAPPSLPGREGGGEAGTPEDVYHAMGAMLASQGTDQPVPDDLSSIPTEAEPPLPAQKDPTPKELRIEAAARARERRKRDQKRLGRFKPPDEIKHSPRAVGEAAREHQRARREESQWEPEKAPRRRPLQGPTPDQLAEQGLAEPDVTPVPEGEGLRFDRVPSSTPPTEGQGLPESAEEITPEEAARLESGRAAPDQKPQPSTRPSQAAPGQDRTIEMLERLLGKVDMLASGLSAIDARLAELEDAVREMGTLG